MSAQGHAPGDGSPTDGPDVADDGALAPDLLPPSDAEALPVDTDGEPAADESPASSSLEGSAKAKLLAAAVLEVLAGIRTPASASESLGLAISRYYVLETRAVQGLIDALEARPRGRRRSSEAEIAKLQQEKQRLEREVARSQALVRATERAMGALPRLPSKPQVSSGGKSKRRAKVRATKAITVLRAGVPASRGSAGPIDPDA